MTKATPTKTRAGLVQLHQVPRAVAPPQRWDVNSTHGKLRCDSTNAGRLARLEDVAVWLMAQYELPPADATAWLCDSIEAEKPPLYLLNESGFAVALPDDRAFDPRFLVLGAYMPQSAAADCGLAGAVKHMRQYWDTATPSKSNYYGQSVLDPLAIRLDQAFALWGYGILEPLQRAEGPIVPTVEWQQNTAWGYMGFDATPAGRLVRLADVVRWFESAKALPRSNAIDALCDGLHAGALGALYRVQLGEFAEPMPANHTYGYRTVSQTQAAHVEAKEKNAATARAASWRAVAGDGGYSATGNPAGQSIGTRVHATQTQQAPVAPGMPALLRRIRQTWGQTARKAAGDVLDDPHTELATLAIRLDMAFQLWGWGGVAAVTSLRAVPATNAEPETWTDLVSFRKEHGSAEWTVTQKGIAASEATRRKAVLGARGVAVAMAGELDITVSRFNDLIRNSSVPGKRKTARKKSA